ncbi:hypothetical protein J6590_088676 [Homalodisca vitripennis]|nr:hypothetical protein J6590_087901 [Homalodisca vitripennis]KAG8324584.1 hypothetical protein J6590_088676 [Homalodisca vitripennis]
MSKRGRQANAGPKPPENNQNKTLESQGLGLPVLKTVAVPPQLLPEPTAMAAVKLLCAPRLEHYILLGPVLEQVADTQVLPLPTPWRSLWRQYIDDINDDITRNYLRSNIYLSSSSGKRSCVC